MCDLFGHERGVGLFYQYHERSLKSVRRRSSRSRVCQSVSRSASRSSTRRCSAATEALLAWSASTQRALAYGTHTRALSGEEATHRCTKHTRGTKRRTKSLGSDDDAAAVAAAGYISNGSISSRVSRLFETLQGLVSSLSDSGNDGSVFWRDGPGPAYASRLSSKRSSQPPTHSNLDHSVSQ